MHNRRIVKERMQIVSHGHCTSQLSLSLSGEIKRFLRITNGVRSKVSVARVHSFVDHACGWGHPVSEDVVIRVRSYLVVRRLVTFGEGGRLYKCEDVK